MFVIGLTGGIGTGKTQVSRILEEIGAEVVSADLVGHEAYRPHTEAWREVVRAFGEQVLTPSGEVDRKKLGVIVFNDSEALKRLNAIMHPRLYKMLEERIKELCGKGRDVVVVEAALFLEANWAPLVNEVWVTVSPEDEVVRRLQARDQTDEEAVRARIRSQMPQADRARCADVVIENNGSLAELRDRIQGLWNSRVLARKESNRPR